MRGLHYQRQPEIFSDLRPITLCRQHCVARRRDVAGEPDQLGAQFIEAQRGRHHATAGIRNFHQLERALHRAVFAITAMQREKHARVAVAFQFEQRALGRVESVRIHAFAAQPCQHRVAREQGNLPFRRAAAHEDRDLPKIERREAQGERRIHTVLQPDGIWTEDFTPLPSRLSPLQ